MVTYSSITTNEADSYGEQVTGTRGTLAICWAERRISEPSATSTSTTHWTARAGLPDTLTSRGYREEQEHLAWLIRNPGKGVPRCGAEVGLADAVVTLVSNMAARARKRIEFKPSWFDVNSNEVPVAV